MVVPMFKKPDIDIGKIVPTSKVALKLSCLSDCDGDMERADKLYSYMAADLPSLPDIDAARPTLIQQADAVVGWFGQHENELSKIFLLLKGVTGKVNPPVNVPPIPPIE